MYRSIEQAIGNTPLVELAAIKRALGLKAKLFAKVESLNPGGSIKDRVAKAMIDDAERSGRLKTGGTVIEATSGNTGIGLAMVATARGYKAVIVMPDTMTAERRKLIAQYGAEIVLTPGRDGMKGAVDKANAICSATENSVIAGQFDNPVCVTAHYQTTAKEIWAQTQGDVDVFVAGVGTGGTLTGVAKFLKEQTADVKIVAVEPAKSPLLSKGISGAHGIQGIGANFVPSILDRSVIDCVATVTDEDAFAYAKMLGKTEGIFVGISSGAALAAAVEEAKKEENVEKNIVVILPDNGDRYLSTPLAD